MGGTCNCMRDEVKKDSVIDVIINDPLDSEIKNLQLQLDPNLHLSNIEKKTPRGVSNPSQSSKKRPSNMNSLSNEYKNIFNEFDFF